MRIILLPTITTEFHEIYIVEKSMLCWARSFESAQIVKPALEVACCEADNLGLFSITALQTKHVLNRRTRTAKK